MLEMKGRFNGPIEFKAFDSSLPSLSLDLVFLSKVWDHWSRIIQKTHKTEARLRLKLRIKCN